jgi:glycosyltransferase involved in cell wall biosynthesis
MPDSSKTLSRGATVCHLTTAHRALDNRIFDSEVLSLARAGYTVTVVGQHLKEESIAGVRVLPLPKPHGKADRWLKLPLRILQAARRVRAQVYHFHDPDLIPVGVLLSLTGARVVYDAHEDYEQKLRSRNLPAGLRRVLPKVWWCGERLASAFFAQVITADSHTQAKFPVGKATTLANFPPLAFGNVKCEPRKCGRPFQIMYVGGLTRDRGLVQVVEALVYLQDLDVEFHIAGETQDGWLLEQFKRPRVVYHGRIPWQGVNRFLAAGDVGVAMLQPIPAYTYYPGENIVKLWEYLAVGLPVVISDFPKLRKLIERLDCGLVADPTSPKAIADAVRKLYGAPAERQRLGENGRRAVREEYNWEKQERKLLDLYARLLPVQPAGHAA